MPQPKKVGLPVGAGLFQIYVAATARYAIFVYIVRYSKQVSKS